MQLIRVDTDQETETVKDYQEPELLNACAGAEQKTRKPRNAGAEVKIRKNHKANAQRDNTQSENEDARTEVRTGECWMRRTKRYWIF